MTQRINIPESKKYLPLIKDIIKSMQTYGESFEHIALWSERVKITYKDTDYPYCIVVIRKGNADTHNIPNGIVETVNIDIAFEMKSYNEGKTEMIYDFIEDVLCMISSGSVELTESKYYRVKELKVVDWEYVPNTDGSYIFDSARVTLEAMMIVCKDCKEVGNE